MAFVNDFNTGKTIDVERGIVLSPSEHDRENNYTFVLEIEGGAIKFSAQYTILPDGSGQAYLSWKIFKITLPDNFTGEKELICNVIVEALEEYGLRQMKKNIKKIDVDFLPTI